MEAEPATLNGPPPLLERLVLALIPPAARETVGGDLCELYHAPLQYAVQAATALPFVIASQARRNANIPLLALQGLILLGCFGGLFAVSDPLRGQQDAVLATAVSMFGLFVLEAYQRQERPSCQRAILETILITGFVSVFMPQFVLSGEAARMSTEVWWPGFLLLGCMIGMIPILCCLRAGLILEVDRRRPCLEEMSVADIPAEYARFRRDAAFANKIECAALLGAAALGGLLTVTFGIGGSFSLMLIGGFIAVALYLLLDGTAQALPPSGDFLSLRALYQYELARRHQLRRFLGWLWCAPLFLMLYTQLILHGAVSRHPSEVTLGILVALLLGFFLNAFNRESAGIVREKIALLGRLQECIS
jgi:hypothetical protein